MLNRNLIFPVFSGFRISIISAYQFFQHRPWKYLNSISFVFMRMTKVLSKQIKVSVGFDNFEMGFEKQEIGGLEPHVCHQLLTNQRLVMTNPFYPMFFLYIILIMIPTMLSFAQVDPGGARWGQVEPGGTLYPWLSEIFPCEKTRTVDQQVTADLVISDQI